MWKLNKTAKRLCIKSGLASRFWPVAVLVSNISIIVTVTYPILKVFEQPSHRKRKIKDYYIETQIRLVSP